MFDENDNNIEEKDGKDIVEQQDRPKIEPDGQTESASGSTGNGWSGSSYRFSGEQNSSYNQPQNRNPQNTPPVSGQRGYQYGQQNWQSGTPYSPPYSGNGQYSRPQQPQGQPQQQQPPQQQYNPYQYNANSGWQTPPRGMQDNYEWKLEDYENAENKNSGKKRNKGMVVFTVSLLCVLAVGLIGLSAYSIISASGDDTVVEEEGMLETPDSDSAETNGGQLEIANKPDISESLPVGGKMSIPQVAEAVLPSVVGVIKYDNEQFFEMSGYGSGIVMSEDGYIITNAHVVAEGTGFKVQMYDGEAYDAVMIGYDSMTDLAVIKIEAEGLVPAQFGDSSEIKVGETVIAVGNPAGMELASSVTQGIVSAVNREVRTTNYNMTYIQTDAAINPGNSGGALANEYAQVIGINSSKIVAEGYEGIGFAIPISTAKPVIDDIIANGRVTGRVMLGITCQTVDEIDARNYGIQMGLIINSIDEQSDLIGEGVQRGDIITHIDGERVYNLSDIRVVLDKNKPGDTVTLTIYRKIGSKEVTYDAKTRLMENVG